MGQLGADIDGLDRLQRLLSVESTALLSSLTALTSAIDVAWWEGQDARDFRSRWEGNYRPTIRKVVEFLEQLSKHVRQQAEQQRRTSAG